MSQYENKKNVVVYELLRRVENYLKLNALRYSFSPHESLVFASKPSRSQ